jgi:multidrug efflux pump subunit AcrB
MPSDRNFGLISIFAQHRVAPNLLMAMMLLAGVWALVGLNKQFFPNFALDFVTVRVAWTGASAEDIEAAITNPIEEELRTLDQIKKLYSTSADGRATITLEYHEGTDMGEAIDHVKERVGLIRNLPITSEEPEIARVVRYEPIAKMLISGPETLRELRPLARQIERELLERGIDKIEVVGLAAEEIAIEVTSATLRELNLSIPDLAQRVNSASQDTPAGVVGRDDAARQLRTLQQGRSALDFERLPIMADGSGRRLTVGDIAAVERRARTKQTQVLFHGRPAVEFKLRRTENGDSLDAAAAFQRWLTERRPTLPPGVEVFVYDESWSLIRDRIELLLRNGAGGLILVVAILFLFLNGRVAWWVAVGIPVSFMAALGVLKILGGSINMISLFALIMTLGIIVDDAIVVGEDALSHFSEGLSPADAAENGAFRMLAPVMSSSLTTVAAFMPLMLVSGIIGNILFDIPLIVICVIAASLVESFLVLPGHLRGSLAKIDRGAPRGMRRHLDNAFAWLRDTAFRPLVRFAVGNTSIIIAFALASLFLAVGLVGGKRIEFVFFPSPESSVLSANVGFVAGTPPERVKNFMLELEHALQRSVAVHDEPLVKVSFVQLGEQGSGRNAKRGDQFAALEVELIDSDKRTVRNPEFIEAWKREVTLTPGVESFSITERRAGPPGRDAEVQLIGTDAHVLKLAALELGRAIGAFPGVLNVDDDLPFGPEQLIYDITPLGAALGLDVESIGRQLRAAYDGQVAQIFQDSGDEIEVRVVLADEERNRLDKLVTTPIMVPGGEAVPLGNVVTIRTRRGFEILRHTNGRLSAKVEADVDPAITSSDAINSRLVKDVLPQLEEKYGITYSLEGRAADRKETLADMGEGLIYALVMIYLVLAWVFSSYGWPFVVMSAIPFGLVGGIAGHWLMGIDLTILSLFGLFGLSGIVINDSIILVSFYKQLKDSGMDTEQAIVEAACRRLRAVLLTSLTTIAGLTPLLFETSLQAQFLIPMAVSISFGLAFGTFLVLVFIPALLAVHERVHERFLASSGRSPALHQ